MENVYFIGVDVGTGSVRAALVSEKGKVLETCIKNIETWNPNTDFYEQSSEDIWQSCIYCIKKIVENINPKNVKGIGFDATCSLVALDTKGLPLTVSPTGNNNQNIILWMDHRAYQEAAMINSTNHRVLSYVGGKISLEMETPKLLWLKKNLKNECWDKAGFFFDLPDFLTWRATGSQSRSLCSLVCKWTYEVQGNGSMSWNESYFRTIGLEDLLENDSSKIGNVVLYPGSSVGNGLCEQAAKEFGLEPGTAVGASIIDAHAGGLGLIGCSVEGISNDFHTRMGLICGTSTCHMALSNTPIFTPGIWGPYYSAMIPGMWLAEGGQSATGKLLDCIINSHPATPQIRSKLNNTHIQKYLSNILEKLTKERNLLSTAFLTQDLHVWPDFHGNRSPIADPTLKGSICGLTLATDEENLAILYLATVQALSYGTKHILDTLNESAFSNITSILICGGLSKNPLFVQTQADVVNLPVIYPQEVESVLLGSAILGASAANHFNDIETAIRTMGGQGIVVKPNPEVVDFHKKKYKIFLEMLNDQLKYRKIMHS